MFTAVLAALALPQLSPIPIEGSCIRVVPGQIAVGLREGGIACFDSKTLANTARVNPVASGATNDCVWLNGKPWWVQEGQSAAYTTDGSAWAVQITLPHIPKRLSVWLGKLVVHYDPGTEFIDPGTLESVPVESILAKEISGLLPASYSFAYSDTDGAYFSLIRPFKDSDRINQVTGWRRKDDGSFELLGHYTTKLADLASTRVRNISVGKEGLLGLSNDEAVAIPFAKEKWEPIRTKLDAEPHRSQVACFQGSTAYWAEGRNIFAADIGSGAVDQYLSCSTSERVQAIATDEEAVYFLGNGTLTRFDLDGVPEGFLALSTVDAEATPTMAERAIAAAEGLNPNLTQEEFVAKVCSTADLPTPFAAAPLQTSEPLPGDLIQADGQSSIYLGGSKVLAWREGKAGVRDIAELSNVAAYSASLADSGDLSGEWSIVAGRPSPLSEVIRLVGVGKPNPRLGTNLFVRVDPSSGRDTPFLPVHYRLQSIMNQWLGVPYLWGGESLSGTDCSGFVTSVYREIGIKLPRHSQSIARAPYGSVVTDVLNYGDVLVYPRPKHVAIYVGQGRTMETLIHQGVGISNIWRRDRAYVRRFIQL